MANSFDEPAGSCAWEIGDATKSIDIGAGWCLTCPEPVEGGLPLRAVEKSPLRGCAHGDGVGSGDPYDNKASVRQPNGVTA